MAVKNIEEYQLMAAKIASRVRKDSRFRASLLKDPKSALSKFRMGKDALRELINEDAYLRRKIGGPLEDCTVTCICTDSCCVTCWVGSSAKISRPSDLVESAVKFGGKDPKLKVSSSREKLVHNLISKGHISGPK